MDQHIQVENSHAADFAANILKNLLLTSKLTTAPQYSDLILSLNHYFYRVCEYPIIPIWLMET